MRKLVYKGFTLELTEATYESFQAEIAAQEKEEKLMDSLFKSLAKARKNGDWDFYSDLYKDCYGVRPISW